MTIRSLTNALENCRAKYTRLGVQLGLAYAKIKELESYNGDVQQCLMDMLWKYVNNMSPDVEEVCQAVEHVDRRDLAADLRERKYKGNVGCQFHSLQVRCATTLLFTGRQFSVSS